MTHESKHFAPYIYNRDLQTFWKGDAAKAGSRFRSVAIVSNQSNSTDGAFQVYAIEGTGKGIQNGKFAGSDDNTFLLTEEALQGIDAADVRLKEIAEEAMRSGFEPANTNMSLTAVTQVLPPKTFGS